MAQIQSDILRRSVTRDETEAYAVNGHGGYGGGIMRFTIAGAAGPGLNLPYAPPQYWSPGRDTVLKAAYRNGGQWGSAVNIAVTKVMVAGYELDGDVAIRVRHAREMLGAGWIDLLTRLGRDYVTTDNGAFIEVVRATKAYGSKVLGFVALSSARCIRTGDPEIPVIYCDMLGQYHELKAHQVAEFSDMPDDDYYGVGLCATSRAWDAIYEDLAVSNYFKEKATGRRPTAMYFVTGFGPQGVSDAIAAAQEDTNRKGAQAFMGAAIAANPNPTTPNLITIPLMSLPDGFDEEKHLDITHIKYANAIGCDPTDLNPRLIGNRALGAGSQAQVLDDKADSKGLISLRYKLSAFLNDTERWHPLPGGTTFAWSERDLKDQQAKAGIAQTRAATRKTQVESGEITAEQALQLAVDAGDVPESFIAVDATTEETLTDEDKATEGIDQPNEDAVAVESEPIINGMNTTKEEDWQIAKLIASGKAQPPDDYLHAYGFVRDAGISRPKADALGVALKASAAATTLARIIPSPADEPGSGQAKYWREVTKALDEVGRIWAIAARGEVPQDEGETARSIKHEISGRNGPGVTLKLIAGNSERPEVAIRATLFGRKGFGAKRGKVLRFKVGNQIVYARKVRGVAANDWNSRAMERIAPQLKEVENKLASLTVNQIAASDIAGAHVYHVAPPAPGGSSKKKRKRK